MTRRRTKGIGRLHTEKPSRIVKVGGVALLTLIALVLSAWANATFHPALGNLLPWTVLFLGIVAMIGAALE